MHSCVNVTMAKLTHFFFLVDFIYSGLVSNTKTSTTIMNDNIIESSFISKLLQWQIPSTALPPSANLEN